ncbi:MAG: hypothetical protein IPL41_13415 [Micropruina sp.]|nr:hypothetical protein [Micropruina sp.]
MRRTLTGWPASVLRASLPGEPARLTALDAAIRAPLPLSTGVGVIGAGPDAPTALVGALVAGVLAARRPQWVLAVGASSAERGIAWQAGLGSSAEGSDDAATRRSAATSGSEATAGLARTPGGLFALELGDRPGQWWQAVAPITRFFDFVVTDWGTPDDPDDARAASAVLLVVVAARRPALQAGVDLAHRLTTPHVAPLLVVHDTGAGTEHGLREAALVNDAHWLPADRGLRSSRPADRRLRYATNRAVLELSAAVVDRAVEHNLEAVIA